MRRTNYRLLAAAIIASVPAMAAEEHRELGPHEHGHGRLNIVIEGKRVSMELEVPGADIVGFEHEASTTEQKATVTKAKATLADALKIFKFPAAAHCKLADAKVAIQAEDEHENEHEAAEAKDGDKAEGEAEGGEHHHSEFHVTYAIDCGAPEKLTGIDFKYFDHFAGAQELDINLVTAKGQTHYEVTRDKPNLKLGEIG
ncbi:MULTISPECIES: DUF2796 domain-containing protein [Rhodomicrobium]|uniref:DUF2796 domain-containing protein n=1 Tax=Rhodomicrobium TaxID=1068 RepID=UPI000B4BD532|nr:MULTISPECIES: DUF2796 domain-containing protein [Rhodomicrobium]